MQEKYIFEINVLSRKNDEIYIYCSTLEDKLNQITRLFYMPNKIKFKIYQNKPMQHFTDFGFRIVYRQPYSWQCTLKEMEDIKLLCNENTIICVGGKKTTENNFMVCGVDEALVALEKTESKTKSKKGKGAYWYFMENESFGFTDQEDILLGSANTKLSQNSISWHIQGLGGWNLGNIKGLNTSTDYEKIVMLMDKI